MARKYTKITVFLLIGSLILLQAGMAEPECSCCTKKEPESKREKSDCCTHEQTVNTPQSCQLEKSDTAPAHKQCRCEGECSCNVLCKMPEQNSDVATEVHTVSLRNTVKDFLGQPILQIHLYKPIVLNHFALSRVHKDLPAKPQTIPLRL